MKQFPCVILSACMLFISVISHAQLKQGEKMLGFNLAYHNSVQKIEDEDDSKISEFNFTPELGFGLANNWIVGIQAMYNTYKAPSDEVDGETYKENTFGFGAFVRKFQPFSDRVGIFGQGSVAFAFGKDKVTDTDEEWKTNILMADIKPGLYFLASKRLIVEATFGQLGYTSKKETLEVDGDKEFEIKTNDFDVSFTDGLSFGIKFIL